MPRQLDLDGIHTVVVTPFDRKGEIDLEALGRVVDFVIAGGVRFVIPCGTTGEYYALSMAERKQVIKAVRDRVGKRARLIAGTNSASQREIIELSLFAKELGYEAVMLAAPYYSLPTPPELTAHFKAVAAAIAMPIVLYNFPARTGVDIGLEVLDGLKDCEAVVGIKESSGSIARLHEIMVRYGDRYTIVCGADDQALEYFAWGVRAWIAGASNFLPAEHVALYEACVKRGDLKAGRAIMRAMLPLFMHMEGGKYLQCAKHGCALAGIPAGDPRPPLAALSADEKQAFARIYEQAKGALAPAAAAQ